VCGIAGIVHFDGRPVDPDELRRVTDRLKHRGPDGSGYRVFGRAGLGHRRLAIIDLAGGAQPLDNEDGSVWVSFNGEIYNYQELHRDLAARGHAFRTRSDTEVIVHAYEEWGEACVERLRGMFAFAIWDERQQSLFLARDRLGIKPLVYWHTPERLAFASELQGLAELDPCPSAVDLTAIDYYLELLYIPTPYTIFQGVSKLPPGHTLMVDRAGNARLRRYWQLRFEPDHTRREQDWAEELDATLRETVRLHLLADVPVGAFLSGGIDSGLITAHMSRLTSGPVRTFTIGFEDDEYNEAPAARRLAERLGTEHHEQTVHPDHQGWLPAVIRHHGEPFADSSAVPTFEIARVARERVTVALAGDGGDEAFAGYPWLTGLLGQFTFPPASPRQAIKRLLRNCLHYTPGRGRYTDPLQVLERSRSCFDPAGRRDLWRGSLRRAAGRPSLVEQSRADLAGLDLCSQVQHLDYQWYLPGDILSKVDTASMYHSLEVRVPYLDHRVVELAARIPSAWKLRAGEGGRPVSKYVLRRAAVAYLPPETIQAPKKGFSLPLQRWFAGSDPGALERDLLSPPSRLAELFEPAAVRGLIRAHHAGGRHGSRLWALLGLAEWFRQYPGASLSGRGSAA
jgi:asparagine synthase (glutamine-hydrolysing)